MRVGRKVVLPVAARTRLRITFHNGPEITAQTGRRTAGKTRPPTLTKVHLRIAPGTVPGTVPTVIPEVSS